MISRCKIQQDAGGKYSKESRQGNEVNREQALAELKARVKNTNVIKHSLAVEAIMRKLASLFRDDVEVWGLTGLLHDIDYDRTASDPSMHSIVAADILEGLWIDKEIIYAVKAHNPIHGIVRKRKLDKALFCADPVSGLITASALILPSKKVADVTVDFIMKKMHNESFARGASREQIRSCSELGLSLEEFIGIALKAMQEISGQLGL